jgi:4-hydroxymandelate oxidase
VPVNAQGAEGFRTLGELEETAGRRCSPAVWGYIQGGAGEERTVQRNRDAFGRWALRPRVLAGLSEIDLSTRMLRDAVSVPFYLAPTAYQGMVHPDGERGTARAASAARVLSMVSTLTSDSLEQIAAASPGGPRWFQLYLQPEFSVTQRLIERAERAGYTALVVTADAPLLAVRDRQRRSGFALDDAIPLGNGPDVRPPARELASKGGGKFAVREEATVGWEILDQLRRVTKLPLVVKGILSAEDARLAVSHGAQAVIVSNHGGRQLDGAAAPLDVLPEVVAAVGTSAEVYLDGGIRRANDVLTALALGARAVGLGRPVLWALAVDGSTGVARLLDLLTIELASVMLFTGRGSISQVDRSLVQPVTP